MDRITPPKGFKFSHIQDGQEVWVPEDDPKSATVWMRTAMKRKARYVCHPKTYDIPGCKCGGDYTYSEYEDFLWCFKCEKEFIPEIWGVFDGPILKGVCELMGMNFDRWDIENEKLIPFESDEWDKSWNKRDAAPTSGEGERG